MAGPFIRPEVRGPQSTVGAIAEGGRRAVDRQRLIKREDSAEKRAESAEGRAKTVEERAATKAKRTEDEAGASEKRRVSAEKRRVSAEERAGGAEERTAATFKRTEAEAGESQAFLRKGRKLGEKEMAMKSDNMEEQMRIRQKFGRDEGPMLQEMYRDMQTGNSRRAGIIFQEIMENRGQLEEGFVIANLIPMKHPTTGQDIWVPIDADDNMQEATEDEDQDFDFFYIDPSKLPQGITGAADPAVEKLKQDERLVGYTPGQAGVTEMGGAGALQWTDKQATSIVNQSTKLKGFETQLNTTGNIEARWIEGRMKSNYRDMELNQAYLQAHTDYKYWKKIDALKGKWKVVPPIEAFKMLEQNPKSKDQFKETFGALPRGY